MIDRKIERVRAERRRVLFACAAKIGLQGYNCVQRRTGGCCDAIAGRDQNKRLPGATRVHDVNR